MSYQAFYRKYRPVTFSDVIGQEHITEVLKRELSEGKIFHAYLFTGTRGTGKTTCAKILAKAVNCQNQVDGDPCGDCELCKAIAAGDVTDITEIDAASNNSVESIRDLRDQVNFAPAAAKYRVYIIDEVHMLTISAFNALLKTLEEPPAHVVFILATTEVHKLPATILSRCQRFDFRRIDTEKICERIKYICGLEGLEITDDAATLIAAAADGGMRDALSILDLCASKCKSIDEAVVSEVCGFAGDGHLNEFARCIKQRDTGAALSVLDELYTASVDMLRLAGELTGYYRNLMIIKTVKSGKLPVICSNTQLEHYKQVAEGYELSEILRALNLLEEITVKMQNGDRRCEMEMLVIKLCSPELCNDIQSLEQRISLLEERLKNGAPAALKTVVTKPEAVIDKPVVKAVARTGENTDYGSKADDDEIPLPEEPDDSAALPEPVAADTVRTADNNTAVPFEKWQDIMRVLQKTCPLMAGVLAGSQAFESNGHLLIDCKNPQFLSLVRGNNPAYRDHIKKAALEVTGIQYKLGPYQRQADSVSDDPLARFADKLKMIEIPKKEQ